MTGPISSDHQAKARQQARFQVSKGSAMIKSGLTGVDEASSTFIAQTKTGVLGLHLNRAPSPGVEARGGGRVSGEAGQDN